VRRASIAAILVLATLPAWAESLIEKWKTFDPRSIASDNSNMATLHADQRAVVAYVAAMRRYQTAAGQTNPERYASSFLSTDRPMASAPWTWTASDGDTVRRMENGAFRVFLGNYLGNWFTEFDCAILEWPIFRCSDGKERKMSAPDPTTMILDGVEYRRFLPTYPDPSERIAQP
jgi:hypothetical protein